MRFRKKPMEVEAIQWDGTAAGAYEVLAWSLRRTKQHQVVFLYDGRDGGRRYGSTTPLVKTLEGDMKMSAGDWLIQGVKGELYPCKPDVFEQSYDRVEEAGPKVSACPDCGSSSVCDCAEPITCQLCINGIHETGDLAVRCPDCRA